MDYIQSELNKTKNDKFILVLNFPDALNRISNRFAPTSNDIISKDHLQLSIASVTIPEISIPNIVLGYSGQSMKLSSHARESYPNMNVKFVIDNGFKNYFVIYSWLNILNNERTSIFDEENIVKVVNGSFSKEYMSTFSLLAFDEYENHTCTFNFTMAFPTKLGKIEWDYRSGDDIPIEFEFAYSQLFLDMDNKQGKP